MNEGSQMAALPARAIRPTPPKRRRNGVAGTLRGPKPGIPIAGHVSRFYEAGKGCPHLHSKNNMAALDEKNDDFSAQFAPEAAVPKIKHVLVVDDNADAADTLGALLTAWGYDVTVAHDGPAALAALQDTTPDIALLDIGMPAMDGYELAAHLRFQPGCEDLPVVAVTGFGGPEDIRRSRAKGFAGHLVKPVDVASLVKFLK